MAKYYLLTKGWQKRKKEVDTFMKSLPWGRKMILGERIHYYIATGRWE